MNINVDLTTAGEVRRGRHAATTLTHRFRIDGGS
jgi:hypothetical protein